MATFTPESAIAWIEGARYKSRKNGLNNIRALLRELGNPEQSFRCVHIAGTNGKGSTSAFVERALRECGYRTGLYTSPYLCRFNERMRVNGVPIDDASLVEIAERLEAISNTLILRGIYPTFFELGTALSFEYFRKIGVEVAVIEVGLGGRLDSTNVITPEVSLIAMIGLDHTKTLGETLPEIAAEKAGIIKPGIPAVCTAQGEDVMRVFRDVCKERGSALTIAERPEILMRDARMSRFSLRLPHLGLGEYEIHLPGAHQCGNAALALWGLDSLAARGFDRIKPNAVREGLRAAKWPGRLEWVDGLLLDVAHNPQGVQSLSDYIAEHFAGRHITLLTGMMKDKEYDRCAEIFATFASRVVTTQIENVRPVSAEELRDAFLRRGANVVAEPSMRRALELVRQNVPEDGIVLCAGSVWLTGEIRNLVTRDDGAI